MAHWWAMNQRDKGSGSSANGFGQVTQQEKSVSRDTSMTDTFTTAPQPGESRDLGLMASIHAPKHAPTEGSGLRHTEAQSATQQQPMVGNGFHAAATRPLEHPPLLSGQRYRIFDPAPDSAPKRVFAIPSPSGQHQIQELSFGKGGGLSQEMKDTLVEVPAPDRATVGTIYEIKPDGTAAPVLFTPADTVWYQPRGGSVLSPYLGFTGVRSGPSDRGPAAVSSVATVLQPQSVNSSACGPVVPSTSVSLAGQQATSNDFWRRCAAPLGSKPSPVDFAAALQQATAKLDPKAAPFAYPAGQHTASIAFSQQNVASGFDVSSSSASQTGHHAVSNPFAQQAVAMVDSKPATFSFSSDYKTCQPSTYTGQQPAFNSGQPSTSWFGQPSARPVTASAQTAGTFFGRPVVLPTGSTWSFGRPSQPSQSSSSQPSSSAMQAPPMSDTAARRRKRNSSQALQQSSPKSIKQELEDGEILDLSPWRRRSEMQRRSPAPFKFNPPALVPTAKAAPPPASQPAPQAAPRQPISQSVLRQADKAHNDNFDDHVVKQRQSLRNIAADRIRAKKGSLRVVIKAWESVLEEMKRNGLGVNDSKTPTAPKAPIAPKAPDPKPTKKKRKQRGQAHNVLSHNEVHELAREAAQEERNSRQMFQAMASQLRQTRGEQQQRQSHPSSYESAQQRDDRLRSQALFSRQLHQDRRDEQKRQLRLRQNEEARW
ncbi:unnamed protein product [Zymoseptoria tritici ST99CH_1A5]|uniref:Uncharacterized protein n=1 Tax=Zymoseptoria tritici ST99CH_1A5 TaxID=1276529 RepID=A0A1Y6LKJ2_ZYMTR|nr:unnamed protein product [Zymoseptoria tritici ST99CH_1A5]